MQQQDKSFLVFGDGIFSSSIAVADPYCCSSKKSVMDYDITLLQTLLFIITPYFLMLALASDDEDDDDSDGGMMVPAYNPS